MSNPDLSTSAEHVALAKVLRESLAVALQESSVFNRPTNNRGERYFYDPDRVPFADYLAMADAAITHLGSGYRMPPATEANAERLARNVHALDYPGLSWETVPSHKYDLSRAARYLRALHTAFAEPAEKPEASCPTCGKEKRPTGPQICSNAFHLPEKPEPVFPGMPAPEVERCSDGCICERCGWPLAASVKEGCVKGNCSQRPLPPMPAPEPSFNDILNSEARINAPTVAQNATVAKPYPPGPTPCGDAKFIPPSGARPDGSLVTHVVEADPDSPADPTVCRPGCDRKFGHLGECEPPDSLTGCDPTDCDICQAKQEDRDKMQAQDGPDFAAEAAERERLRLLEAFMRDLVGNPAVMAKMLENYEADEDAIAARLHEIALAFAQELIG